MLEPSDLLLILLLIIAVILNQKFTTASIMKMTVLSLGAGLFYLESWMTNRIYHVHVFQFSIFIFNWDLMILVYNFNVKGLGKASDKIKYEFDWESHFCFANTCLHYQWEGIWGELQVKQFFDKSIYDDRYNFI